MDLFGNKALEEAGKRLQKSFNNMIEFHERLRLFIIDLKELKSPDVDALFEKHQVKITYPPPDGDIKHYEGK